METKEQKTNSSAAQQFFTAALLHYCAIAL